MGSGFYTHFEEPIRSGMRISEESNQRNPGSAACVHFAQQFTGNVQIGILNPIPFWMFTAQV